MSLISLLYKMQISIFLDVKQSQTNLAEIPSLPAQHSLQCRLPHDRGWLGRAICPDSHKGSTGLNGTEMLPQSTANMTVKEALNEIIGV